MLLSLTYLSTAEFKKASNSSMDSGRGSATGFGGAGGAAGGVDANVVEGEAIGGFRAGASLGMSVEEAISSSRDVAASRLGIESARRRLLEAGRGRGGGTVPFDKRR